MNRNIKKPGILVLEDGTVFYGNAAGYPGTATGELCFNTGMTGYQEIFTDPSYLGQILIATNAHIGNYGTCDDDAESPGVKISGLVCRNFTIPFSRKAADVSIEDYFIRNRVVAVEETDTRALVRHIRNKGAMNGIISSVEFNVDKLREMLREVPSMNGLELASKATSENPWFFGNPDARFRVAVLDLGTKLNILKCLAERDCYVQVFPASAPVAQMKEWQPSGYVISNGPGDPAALAHVAGTVAGLLEEDLPLFGICLGHQVLAEACGAPTYKMHHGHRGINHPVKNLLTGKCEITSQNHGFCVSRESVEKSGRLEITHVNLNDDTVEGIRVKDSKAFSVQYHPESAPGPHDSRYLFDQFTEMLAY